MSGRGGGGGGVKGWQPMPFVAPIYIKFAFIFHIFIPNLRPYLILSFGHIYPKLKLDIFRKCTLFTLYENDLASSDQFFFAPIYIKFETFLNLKFWTYISQTEIIKMPKTDFFYPLWERPSKFSPILGKVACLGRLKAMYQGRQALVHRFWGWIFVRFRMVWACF